MIVISLIFFEVGQNFYWTNGRDSGHVLELKQFQSVAKVGNKAKPIMIVSLIKTHIFPELLTCPFNI